MTTMKTLPIAAALLFILSPLSAMAQQVPDINALKDQVNKAQADLTALENKTVGAIRDTGSAMIDQAAKAAGVTLTPEQKNAVLNGALTSIWDPGNPPSADAIKNAIANEFAAQVGGVAADLLAGIDANTAEALSGMFETLGNMEGMAAEVENLLQNLNAGIIPTGIDVVALANEFTDVINGALSTATDVVTSVASDIIANGVASAADLLGITAVIDASEYVSAAVDALGAGDVQGVVADALGGVVGDALGGALGGVIGGLAGDLLGGFFGGLMGDQYQYTGSRNYLPPFGGYVEEVFYCTCSFNILTILEENLCTEPATPPADLNLAAPSCLGAPKVLSYNPFTTSLYPYYQIYRPGVWLLGLWRGLDACRVYTGFGCITVGYYPHMTMVGTSY